MEKIKLLVETLNLDGGSNQQIDELILKINAVDLFPRIEEEYPLLSAVKEAFATSKVLLGTEPCITLGMFEEVIKQLKSKGKLWPKPTFSAGPVGKRVFVNFRDDREKGQRWSRGNAMKPTVTVTK